MILKTFVLVGTIVSHDAVLSTVEFNLNPATNGGPSVAVMPNYAIPCEVKIGQVIHVVKNKEENNPIITCALE